jgi:diguanylate cyclase (GGDEF)-like protein
MRVRLAGEHDGLLLAGLALALLTIFDQTLGRLLQAASEVEAAYHVRLLPALVVLVAILIVHLHARRQEMKARAAAAAAEARAAEERAVDLELLAAFGRALTGVLTEDALRAALWRHLPLVAGRGELWVGLGDGSRFTLLVETTGDAALAGIAEECSRRVLSTRAPDGALGVVDGRYRCFVIEAVGRPLGVIGVSDEQGSINERSARLLGAAAALVGIAVRNVQLFTETRRDALTDSLTQCYNRGHIVQVIEAELRRARRTRSPLSLVMLDIDGFKAINDRVGHLGGDEILASIGARLKHVLRSTDMRGRFGGDEFLIVLPDTPAAGAAYVAEALRREIEALEVTIDDGVVRVTASVGVASALADELDPNALVGRADRALYAAKDAGRNAVRTGETPSPTVVEDPTLRRAS